MGSLLEVGQRFDIEHGVHDKEDQLCGKEQQQHQNSQIVLPLLQLILGLFVVVELDLQVVGMLHQSELDICDILALYDLIELLQEVPLGHLSLDVPNHDAEACHFALELLFLKLEERL